MRNPCAGALPLDGVPRVAYTGLMRGWYGVLALALLAWPTAAAEINVRVAEGRVDLSANAAPVADVLDRLSKQTGMKVVYEGPPPRQLVSVSLAGRTPAEAVVGLLEGLGLNYMLLGDPSGTRVQTLMMAGAAPATPSARSANANPSLRMSSPAPGSSPDAEEAAEEPAEEPEPAQPLNPVTPPGIVGGLPGMPPNPARPVSPGSPPVQSSPGLLPPSLPGATFPGGTPSSLPSGFPTSPFPAGIFGPRPVVLPTPLPGNVQPTAPAPGAEQKPDAPPP